MSQIKFYQVTQTQYDALNEPETDAFYFTSDTHKMYIGKKNYTRGIAGNGHIISGYTVPVFGYEESDENYVLLLSPESEAVDFSKFTIGKKIKLSLVREVTSEGSENEYSYVEAEVDSVDAANFRIGLTESIRGGNITVNTRIGLQKVICSGYTASATGGPSVYRVTLPSTEYASSLFAGAKIYTRTGNGNLTANSVAGVDGQYLYLSSPAAGTNSVYFGAPNVYLTDEVPEEDKHEAASGINNFVSGESSGTNGAWNVVIGVTANAIGNSNTVIGNMAVAVGNMNFVTGDVSFAIGSDNEITDSSSVAIGNGNKLHYQSEYAIGTGNEISGVSCFAFGNVNRITSYGNIVFGQNAEMTGKYSLAFGYRHKVAAHSAYVFGRYAEVADLPENKNALIFHGGTKEDSAEAFAVRCFKSVANPQYDPNKDPTGSGKDSTGETQYIPGVAYSLRYRGHLQAVKENITLNSEGATTAILDHDRYARWELAGSGEVTLALANWINGDRGELLVNTGTQAITFPQEWIMPDSFDITSEAGVYLLEIRKENDAVYMHQLLPYKE